MPGGGDPRPAAPPSAALPSPTRARIGGIDAWLLPPDFYREREPTARDWVEGLVEPVALVVLVGLFVGGVTRFLQLFAPGWDSRHLGPLALVVAVEAFLYGRRLARPSVILKEWAVLLTPALLLVKFLPYALGGGDLAADLGEWWRSPFSVFTADFLAGGVLLLVSWWMTLSATLELGYLRLQRGELPPVGDPRQRSRYDADDSSWRRFDHSTPYRNLSSRVLWGGVALAWLGAVSALGSAQMMTPEALLELVTFRRPGPTAALGGVLAYFAVGLLLLAEAAYVRRRTAWQVERLEPPPGVGGAWMLQATVGVLVIVLVALALPTSYALTLSELFGILVGAVLSVVQIVVGLFMLLFLAIMYPLSWLFPRGMGDSPASGPPPAQALPPPAAPIPWLEVLQSLVFWIVALAAVGYVLSVLWRKRPPLPAWAGRGFLGRVLGGLRRLLDLLRRAGATTARQVAAAAARLRPRPALEPARAFRWLALRTLGPRELVEYFYLSVVERATRLGVGREKGETAAEFSRRLPRRIPDSEPDLRELTSAFLEARYGPRQVDEGLLRSARAHWQTLKAKLRARRVGRPRG